MAACLLDDVLRQPSGLEALAGRPGSEQRERKRLVRLRRRRTPALDPRLVRLRQDHGGPLPALRRLRQQQRDDAAIPVALPPAGRQVALAAGSSQLRSHPDPAVDQIAEQGIEHRRLFEHGVPTRRADGEVGRADEPLQCGDVAAFERSTEHVGECSCRRQVRRLGILESPQSTGGPARPRRRCASTSGHRAAAGTAVRPPRRHHPPRRPIRRGTAVRTDRTSLRRAPGRSGSPSPDHRRAGPPVPCGAASSMSGRRAPSGVVPPTPPRWPRRTPATRARTLLPGQVVGRPDPVGRRHW